MKMRINNVKIDAYLPPAPTTSRFSLVVDMNTVRSNDMSSLRGDLHFIRQNKVRYNIILEPIWEEENEDYYDN